MKRNARIFMESFNYVGSRKYLLCMLPYRSFYATDFFTARYVGGKRYEFIREHAYMIYSSAMIEKCFLLHLSELTQPLCDSSMKDTYA